ncbi:TPA: hypothetical protein HA251_03765 [Candidatus Woesearchaeota archaeon]|nr:hypothetical protein [Candidatus Woesearchaeota archaeon]
MPELRGYHYTNSRAYRSIQTKGIEGFFTGKYDEFTGLIPRRRFVYIGDGHGLPNAAHDGVIEGLLEPRPTSWIENPEFPDLWRYLMHDICRKKEVMLLSFPILRSDKAYVVERAHVERELYREAKGLGKPTKETRDEAFRRYWESRVRAHRYDGNYAVPQLAIWSGIPFERLQVEWSRPTDDVWNEVLAESESQKSHVRKKNAKKIAKSS